MIVMDFTGFPALTQSRSRKFSLKSRGSGLCVHRGRAKAEDKEHVYKEITETDIINIMAGA